MTGWGPLDVAHVPDGGVEFRNRATGDLLWSMTPRAACNLVKALVDAVRDAGQLDDPLNPAREQKPRRLMSVAADPGLWRFAEGMDGEDPDGILRLTVDTWWPPVDDGWIPVQGWRRRVNEQPGNDRWVSVEVHPKVWEDATRAVSPEVATG